jgi:hypothetical protein
MKTFKVEYKEVILHTFYVEAETEEDVEEKFCEMAGNGEFDFSDGWVTNGEIVNIEEA